MGAHLATYAHSSLEAAFGGSGLQGLGREGGVTGGGQRLATRVPAPLCPPPQTRLGSHLLCADGRAQPKGSAEAGKKGVRRRGCQHAGSEAWV